MDASTPRNGTTKSAMTINTSSAPQPAAAVTFPPLATETRLTIDTEAAAFHLNRRPQTMRKWACYENGPIRPVRINGRLGWLVADLIRLQRGQGAG